MYFKTASNADVNQKYSFIGRQGFGSVGKYHEKLPAGNYKLTIVNQGYRTGPAAISLTMYATDQSPTDRKSVV